EVNGGFLLGSDFTLGTTTLKALPTRDSILPILCALVSAQEKGIPLFELFLRLPRRYTQAGLLDNFPTNVSKEIVKQFSQDSESNRKTLELFFTRSLGFGNITRIDTTDGIRIYFDNGDIAHIRPSGNAPQLRIYSVANSQERADEIVAKGIAEPDGILRQIERKLVASHSITAQSQSYHEPFIPEPNETFPEEITPISVSYGTGRLRVDTAAAVNVQEQRLLELVQIALNQWFAMLNNSQQQSLIAYINRTGGLPLRLRSDRAMTQKGEFTILGKNDSYTGIIDVHRGLANRTNQENFPEELLNIIGHEGHHLLTFIQRGYQPTPTDQIQDEEANARDWRATLPLQNIRFDSSRRDRHIHLEGAISTEAIRNICHRLDTFMSEEERVRFWDLMTFDPQPNGARLQRFPDITTPQKMREIVLDPQDKDADCRNLRRYSEYNPLWSALPGVTSKVRVYLIRSYSMGSALFDTRFIIDNPRVIQVVAEMALEDVVQNAINEGIGELDLRVKADKREFEKGGNRYDPEFLRALISAVEKAEGKAVEKGESITINLVLSFSRKVRRRITNWDDEEAVKTYIDNNLIGPLRTLEISDLSRIRGIDIVADELCGPQEVRENIPYINYFIDTLVRLRQDRNIRGEFVVYAHAGEAFRDPSDGVEMVRVLIEGVHGLRYVVHAAVLGWIPSDSKTFREVVGILKQKNIGVLVSITSNLQTGAIDSLGQHPAGVLYREGIRIFATTDNPRASATSLSREEKKLGLLLLCNELQSQALQKTLL
ncbi:MAG: hypothetical protein FJZ16_09280, partial [Candidatus Omnitrophica bacterium]|nr:hypothetical protein [Candidatus Omnitrophota bacterium]